MADQARFTSEISANGKQVRLLLAKDVVFSVVPQCTGALRELVRAFETCEWCELSVNITAENGDVIMGIDPYMPIDGPDAIAFLINGETWNVTAGDNYYWILRELKLFLKNVEIISDGTNFKLSTVEKHYVHMHGQSNCLSVYPRDANINRGYELGIKGGFTTLRGFYEIAQSGTHTGFKQPGTPLWREKVKGSTSVAFINIATGNKHRQWRVTVGYNNGTARGFDLTPTNIIGLHGCLELWIRDVPKDGPTLEAIRIVLQDAYKEHPFVPKPELKFEAKPEPEVKSAPKLVPSTASTDACVEKLRAAIQDIVRDELRKARTAPADAKP